MNPAPQELTVRAALPDRGRRSVADSFDYQLPFHMNQVWNMLPHAVQRTKGSSNQGNPLPGGGYRYTFSTGMSLLTYGFNVYIDLFPHPQGTHMRVSPSMKFGIVDWGEGREVAASLHDHLFNMLRLQGGQGGPGGPGGPGQGGRHPQGGHPQAGGPAQAGPHPPRHGGQHPQPHPYPHQHGGYGHGNPGPGYGPAR